MVCVPSRPQTLSTSSSIWPWLCTQHCRTVFWINGHWVDLTVPAVGQEDPLQQLCAQHCARSRERGGSPHFGGRGGMVRLGQHRDELLQFCRFWATIRKVFGPGPPDCFCSTCLELWTKRSQCRHCLQISTRHGHKCGLTFVTSYYRRFQGSKDPARFNRCLHRVAHGSTETIAKRETVVENNILETKRKTTCLGAKEKGRGRSNLDRPTARPSLSRWKRSRNNRRKTPACLLPPRLAVYRTGVSKKHLGFQACSPNKCLSFQTCVSQN